MFKTREKSHLCQNDETFFCSNLYRYVEFCRSVQIFTDPNKDQQITITYSELTANTKITPTNHIPEMLQQEHFINTSTNTEGCHISNFIRQNEVNEAKELLKVQPHLESSGEMDKLRCITNAAHFPVTITTLMGTNLFL